MRVGFGYDVHRLVSGRPLILGGVSLESDLGLDGHSDADVLLHAIADAILGAAAMGDIGFHFPDTDEAWRGADSIRLLERVNVLLLEQGYAVRNVDVTVVMERPKLQPHIMTMRKNIARALEIEVDLVSVKATTSERIGFVGREEGVAAQAVCLIDRR